MTWFLRNTICFHRNVTITPSASNRGVYVFLNDVLLLNGVFSGKAMIYFLYRMSSNWLQKMTSNLKMARTVGSVYCRTG